MRLPIDSDILVFAYTVGKVLIQGPAMLRASAAKRRIPFVYDFKQLSDVELSGAQQKFFQPYDEKLARLGYFPNCTYTVANYGHNIIRRYINAADSAACSVIAIEVKANVKGVVSMTQSSLVEFTTRFADGTRLTTRNSKNKSLMDQQPGRIVQECPDANDPAVLKKRHDTRAARMGFPIPAETNVSRWLAIAQDDHRSFMEYQVERGICQKDAAGYVTGDKAHWRGIRNHLNPFMHRFSVVQLMAAAAVAVGIPAAGYRFAVPAVTAKLAAAGLPTNFVWDLVMMAAYLVAGAAVGLVLQRSVFLWTFLITYVGVHAVTGWWYSPLPLSATAGIMAYVVAQAAKRKKLMLLPEAQKKAAAG